VIHGRSTDVTDGHRVTAYTALMHTHRAVIKSDISVSSILVIVIDINMCKVLILCEMCYFCV